MRVRTFLGILLSLVVVVAAAILAHLNFELLRTPFQLTQQTAVPFYALLLGVFLTAFLPTATLLLVQSVRRDLTLRKERRASREAESLDRAFRRGVDAESDGQWAKANEEFAVVVQGRPESFEARLRQGRALRSLGRHAEAIEVHRHASVLYPQNVALLYELAQDYEASDRSDVAQELTNRIAREFPELSLRVLRQRRQRAMENRAWSEASSSQEKIEHLLGPQSVTERGEERTRLGLAYERGVLLLEEDQVAEATAVFKSLLEREPRFIPASIMLGEAALVEDREEEALAAWLSGYASTGSPVFLQRIEDFCIDGTEPERAIENLWTLIGRSENAVLPRFFLGRLYYRLAMYPEALKVLESIRDEVASSPTYHFLLARIHERMGDLRKALAEYQEAAKEAGVPDTEYRCRVCQTSYPDWRGRCDHCGSWNSVELDFEEERVSAEEMGVRPAPVWGGYGEPLDGEAG